MTGTTSHSKPLHASLLDAVERWHSSGNTVLTGPKASARVRLGSTTAQGAHAIWWRDVQVATAASTGDFTVIVSLHPTLEALLLHELVDPDIVREMTADFSAAAISRDAAQMRTDLFAAAVGPRT